MTQENHAYIIDVDCFGVKKLKLSLDRIKQDKGKVLNFELEEDIDDIKVQGELVKFLGPVKVTGQVENLGQRIFQVNGLINVPIEAVCYRCLSKTNFELNIDFSLKFSDTITESTEDEEELITFSGNEIELRPHVINEIILNWPAQVLCKPDCRGLCPTCGTNLNFSSCHCEDDRIDSRFSVLKNLFK